MRTKYINEQHRHGTSYALTYGKIGMATSSAMTYAQDKKNKSAALAYGYIC